MSASRVIRRVVLSVLGAALLLGGSVIGVLAYPEPLYAYHVEAGRLRLYSDRPFDAEKGRGVLADLEKRLNAAPAELRDRDSIFRVFVTNAAWRKRLVFLWNHGAGGVNYYPIKGSVFLRQGDVDSDRLFKSNGSLVEPPRTMAYYAAHEIGHSLIGEHIGAWQNQMLPAWIREGMADFVAFAGDVDIDALTSQLRAGDPDLDPKKTGLYARYRLLVAFFLKRERWSVDRLLTSQMKLAEAEQNLLTSQPVR